MVHHHHHHYVLLLFYYHNHHFYNIYKTMRIVKIRQQQQKKITYL